MINLASTLVGLLDSPSFIVLGGPSTCASKAGSSSSTGSSEAAVEQREFVVSTANCVVL